MKGGNWVLKGGNWVLKGGNRVLKGGNWVSEADICEDALTKITQRDNPIQLSIDFE